MMTERAITYARVSSASQAEGSSLETQAEECRKFAEAQGWKVVGEYQDDLSGVTSLDRRPGLSAAYTFCIADGVSALVIYDVDRLARDSLQRALILDAFARLEVEVTFVRGGSTATPEDQVFVGFKGVFADYERLQILERMTRGKLARVRSGNPLVNARPPFGYTPGEERDGNGRLVRAWLEVHHDQAETVRRIFAEFTGGANMERIATGLSEDGVPSYADGHAEMDKTRGTGVWGRSSVRNILRNETYVGRWFYGKTRAVKQPNGRTRRARRPREEWIQVDVPPVIDEATWDRTKALLADPGKLPRKSVDPHPLQRRVVCAVSGHRFSRQVSHKEIRPVPKGKLTKTRPYVYWRCNGSRGRADHPARTCDAGPVKGTVLEPAVLDWVARLPHDLRAIRQRYNEQLSDTQPLADELERVGERIARGEGKLERAKDLYIDGEIDKTEYARRSKSIQAGAAKDHTRLAELENLIGTPPDEELTREAILAVEELIDYLRGEREDPAIPVELLLDIYRDLDLTVRVNSMDPGDITATLTSRLGSEVITLGQTEKTV